MYGIFKWISKSTAHFPMETTPGKTYKRKVANNCLPRGLMGGNSNQHTQNIPPGGLSFAICGNKLWRCSQTTRLHHPFRPTRPPQFAAFSNAFVNFVNQISFVLSLFTALGVYICRHFCRQDPLNLVPPLSFFFPLAAFIFALYGSFLDFPRMAQTRRGKTAQPAWETKHHHENVCKTIA